IVLTSHNTERNLSSSVIRGAVVSGARHLVSSAFEGCAIEMIERRDGQDQTRRPGVNPGEVSKSVLLTFAATDQRCFLIRIIRHLVMILAHRTHEPELIRGGGIEDERGERAISISSIVQNTRSRSLESQICT